MKNQWYIRRAVLEDSIGLQDCMASAYTAYQGRMGGRRLPPMDVDYSREIRDFPSWVAEFDGRVACGLSMMFEEAYASIAIMRLIFQ